MSVIPNFLRISKTGTPRARNAALWNIARIGTWLLLNGITAGEWLCTTALTSGRARYTSAWMKRSRNRPRPLASTALPSRSMFDNIRGGHQRRGERAGHQEPVGVLRVAHADVPEGVEHALVDQHTARRHEVVEERRLDGTGGGWRRLRASSAERERSGEGDQRRDNGPNNEAHAVLPMGWEAMKSYTNYELTRCPRPPDVRAAQYFQKKPPPPNDLP